MLKCFKSTDYLVRLTPEQVIGKLKAKTNSPNRLSNKNSEFKGTFTEKTFKFQFESDGNILVHNSYNPVFAGKAIQEKKGTRLSIKMQMNVAGYIMLLIPLLIWLVAVICMIFSVSNAYVFFVLSSIFLFAFIVCAYGISVNTYKDMQGVIKSIFKDELL